MELPRELSGKNPPARQETQVRFLGQNDPLGKETATHSSILAWRVPWTEEPGGYGPWDRKESDMTEATEHAHMQLSSVPPKNNSEGG